MLSTFNIYIITKAYLQGSGLPLATKALRWKCAAAWLGWVHKGGHGKLHVLLSSSSCKGEVQCGWSKSINGSWKVIHLAVFLKPPGVGEVGMVRVSMCELAVRFGTLNSKIPRCSDVMYESRIWGEVVSSNTQHWVEYDLGSIPWFTLAMKCPRKGFRVPSCEIQVWAVG